MGTDEVELFETGIEREKVGGLLSRRRLSQPIGRKLQVADEFTAHCPATVVVGSTQDRRRMICRQHVLGPGALHDLAPL